MSRTRVIVKENKKVEKFEAFVESETTEGIYYRVRLLDGEWECTCPQYKYRGKQCKHISHAKDIKQIDDVQRFD